MLEVARKHGDTSVPTSPSSPKTKKHDSPKAKKHRQRWRPSPVLLDSIEKAVPLDMKVFSKYDDECGLLDTKDGSLLAECVFGGLGLSDAQRQQLNIILSELLIVERKGRVRAKRRVRGKRRMGARGGGYNGN